MRCVLAEPATTIAGGPARARLAVTALAVIALIAAVALLWRWQSDETYVAGPPDATTTSTQDAALAAETLRKLERALLAGDEASARTLGADGAAALLAAAAGNVEALEITDLGMRYLSETDAPMTARRWSAEVEVTWRFDGLDGTTAARAGLELEFADGGRSISEVGREGLTPLWLQGNLVSRRSDGVLVMMADPQGRLARIHQQARTAAAEVRDRLGRDAALVVEVPAGPADLNRAVGAVPGTYDGVAAVTTGADGSVVPGAPLHVFVNPEVYGGLDPLAAQVVMTHEAVHVTTGAPFAQGVPLWLLEGFADFVALQDVDLPLSRSAGQILRQVRRDGVPDSLPTGGDFDTAAGHLGATYEAAWQVCEVLAERRGDAAVVAFYAAVVAGSDVERELRQRFGWTAEELTSAWQERLRTLAASETAGA